MCTNKWPVGGDARWQYMISDRDEVFDQVFRNWSDHFPKPSISEKLQNTHHLHYFEPMPSQKLDTITTGPMLRFR